MCSNEFEATFSSFRNAMILSVCFGSSRWSIPGRAFVRLFWYIHWCNLYLSSPPEYFDCGDDTFIVNISKFILVCSDQRMHSQYLFDFISCSLTNIHFFNKLKSLLKLFFFPLDAIHSRCYATSSSLNELSVITAPLSICPCMFSGLDCGGSTGLF